MILFCYIAYELLVGLAAATAQEKDLVIRGKIQTAQVMTVISWYCAETQPELLRQRYEATEPAAMMMIQESKVDFLQCGDFSEWKVQFGYALIDILSV